MQHCCFEQAVLKGIQKCSVNFFIIFIGYRSGLRKDDVWIQTLGMERDGRVTRGMHSAHFAYKGHGALPKIAVVCNHMKIRWKATPHPLLRDLYIKAFHS